MSPADLWVENAALRDLLKRQAALLEVMQQEVALLRGICARVNSAGQVALSDVNLVKRITQETKDGKDSSKIS